MNLRMSFSLPVSRAQHNPSSGQDVSTQANVNSAAMSALALQMSSSAPPAGSKNQIQARDEEPGGKPVTVQELFTLKNSWGKKSTSGFCFGNALEVAIIDMNDCLTKNGKIICSIALALAAPRE